MAPYPKVLRGELAENIFYFAQQGAVLWFILDFCDPFEFLQQLALPLGERRVTSRA